MGTLSAMFLGFCLAIGCFFIGMGLADIGKGLHAIAKAMERK